MFFQLLRLNLAISQKMNADEQLVDMKITLWLSIPWKGMIPD